MNNAMSSENLVGNGTLGQSVWALIIKRFNIYKRDKCGLVCEILVPVILVLLGLSLLQIGWLTDSPAFVLNTSAFPGPQRGLMNKNIVSNSTNPQISPEDIVAKLPDSASYWDFTYEDSTYISYLDYYDEVTELQYDGTE